MREIDDDGSAAIGRQHGERTDRSRVNAESVAPLLTLALSRVDEKWRVRVALPISNRMRTNWQAKGLSSQAGSCSVSATGSATDS